MEVFNEIEPLKAFLKDKRTTCSIGLVPTMGALHAGHSSLIQFSKQENQLTVTSIFVNPVQFNNPKDLEKYPRMLEHDINMLCKAGCDVLFVPDTQEMYKQPSTIQFDFGHLDKILEGKFRPGHFSGVAIIVSKFFHIVQPNIAYFGQKDFQQFKVIEKLVNELQFDLLLRPVPIFREADGLAMSSRNLRLNETERKKAIVFYESLLFAKQMLLQGKMISQVKELVKQKCELVEGVRLEYFEMVSSENLLAQDIVTEKSILLIAGFVGEVRLIDNLMMTP